MPRYPVSGVSVADADALIADVKTPKTFYSVAPPRKTGTMATVALDPAANAYPAGFHAGAGSLTAVDADLAAPNIRLGRTIFGVAGTMTQWIYDLKAEQSLPPTLVVPIPTRGIAVAESHAGGAFTATPSLVVPAPPALAVTAINSMLLIEDCEAAWDEYVDASVASTADAVDFKFGAASSKLDIAIGANVGRMATHNMAAKDLSPYKYLKLWVRTSVNLNANDMQVMLDEHAQCVSPLKTLNILALTSAAGWTEFTIDMGGTSACVAIISIGIYMAVDKGAFIWHTDQVRAEMGL